jgi:hypothetical protein
VEQTPRNLLVSDRHLSRLLLLNLLQRIRLHQKPQVQTMPPETGHHVEAEAAVDVDLSQIGGQLMAGNLVASSHNPIQP